MEKSDIKDVVVAGAGLMGAGISQMFPGVGIKTTLYSIKESDFVFAKEVLKNNLDFLVENRVIDANQAEAIQRSIKFTTDIQCMKDADLIIEAIPENINIKANFYEEICRSAKEDTIIATNTSAISIDLLSNYVTNKKRFCGTHFLNPPHIIPLVEVIKGQSTDGSVCERLVDFFRQLGKKPVLVKHDIKGFLSNRLQFALLREATYLVEEGTTKKYVSVPLDEFCRNRIRRLEESQRWLKKHMPSEKDHVEGYITIEGSSNILDKIRNLLAKAEERVYISCTRNYLLLFVDELESLIWAKKKVVIVTDQPVNFRNARVYMGNNRGMQIGVITDSRYVLTGEYGEGSINTCLYSGQKNFVELYKSALSNEIKLLAIREENMQ